ncbi:MAG TPA: hypothetical protein VM029_22175 [Opitutaceae bacterium]|nr:hypothetical protein [Opitutaceae bacterium]
MRLRFLCLFLGVLAPLARATTVQPPNFPELVGEADAIYRGQVTGVEARRVARPDGGSTIKTFVTVSIDRVLKGTEEKNVTLEFLGGTIGDETLDVGGMPKFIVGEKGILFVQRNGRQFCPLVRLGHGSYRIEKDPASGRDYVARANRAPLQDVADVEAPLSEHAARSTPADVSRALSPATFESRIVNEVRSPTLRARIN